MKLTDEEKTLVWTAYVDNNFKMDSEEIFNKLSSELKLKIKKEEINQLIQNFEYELYLLEEENKFHMIYGDYNLNIE